MTMTKQEILNEINRLNSELPKRLTIASVAEHEGLEIAFEELTDFCCSQIKAANYKGSKTAIKNLETVKNFKDYLSEQKRVADNIEYKIAELRIELTRCQLDLFKDSKLATGFKHNGTELFTGDVFETINKTYLLITSSEVGPNRFAIVGSAFPEELALQYPKNREILKDTAYLGNMHDNEKLADFLTELQTEQDKLKEKQKTDSDETDEDEEGNS